MIYRCLCLLVLLLLGAARLPAQSLPDAATATRRVETALEDLQAQVHNRVTFAGQAADLEQMLTDYQPRLSMQQVERYRNALQTARAEFQRYAQIEDVARLAAGVDVLEQRWDGLRRQLHDPDLSPNSREAAISDLRESIASLRQAQSALPAPSVADLSRRIDRVAASFEQLVGAADAAAELAALESAFARDTEDYAGWEQEQAIDYARYRSERSALSNAFGLPKTLGLYQATGARLGETRDPPLPAAFRERLETLQAQTRARLLAAVQALVDAAAAADASEEPARAAMGLLDESLRVTLAAESDREFGALALRTRDWLRAAADADTHSAEGLARYYQRMTVSARAAWPDMERQYTTVRGFDPTHPQALEGQLIRIETDNLMGYRFKVGDFPFATTISGLPVAATYDPEVEAAIAEIESKLGRALGDSDDDGRWTVIAEVTGRIGRMQLRKQVEGDIRDASSGEKLGSYRGEEAEAVDAPILRIIAAHIGPLAVAKGIGVARVDGALQPSTGTAAAPGPAAAPGLLARVPMLLWGLLAAALCLAQARPAWVRAQAERAGAARTYDRSRPLLPYAGLLLAVFGVWRLLAGLIVGDLLPALALIAAGLYAALPLAQARGVLPPAQIERLQPAGVSLAALSGLLAGLHLLVGAHWWL